MRSSGVARGRTSRQCFRQTLVTVEAPALRSSLQRIGDHRCQQGLLGWVQGRASAAELRNRCLLQRVLLHIVAKVPRIVLRRTPFETLKRFQAK